MSVCLILGAGSDLGQALAYQFAKHGYNIILAGRTTDDTVKRIQNDIVIRYNVTVQLICFDGNDFESHHAIAASLQPMPSVVIAVFGYLGNNELAATDFSETYKIIVSNYLGHVSFMNALLQHVKQTDTITIAGVSSVAGERGRKSNFIYGSAKAGFTAFLSGLRNAYNATGIHVLTVKPGFIKTRMLKGMKTPQFLTASPELAAVKIYNAVLSKKNVLYVKPVWRYIMWIIKLIPESVLKA